MVLQANNTASFAPFSLPADPRGLKSILRHSNTPALPSNPGQNVLNRHFKPLLEHAGLPLSAGTISGTPALLPSFWGAASTRNSYSIFSGTPA
jgi:hypothetical protein